MPEACYEITDFLGEECNECGEEFTDLSKEKKNHMTLNPRASDGLSFIKFLNQGRI